MPRSRAIRVAAFRGASEPSPAGSPQRRSPAARSRSRSPDAFARGARFALGHFSVWGSTALAGAGRSAAVAGLAFGLAAPFLPALGCLGASRAPAPLLRFLACALGPYAVWVLLGQNLASPRPSSLAPARVVRARPARWRPPSLSRPRDLAARAPAPGRAPSARVSAPARCAPSSRVEPEVLEHAPRPAPLPPASGGAPRSRGWPTLGAIGITSELAGSERLGARSDDLVAGLRLYRIDAAALR
jgi:hypothetical protein